MSTETTEEVVALQMNDNGWQKWQEDPYDYKLAKISREVRVLRSMLLLLGFIAIILLAINVWVLWFKNPSDEASNNFFLSRNGGATSHAQKSNDARDEFHDRINSTCYKELQKVQTVFTAKLAESADELRDVIRRMNTTLTEKVQTVRKMRGPPGPKGACPCLPSPRGGAE